MSAFRENGEPLSLKIPNTRVRAEQTSQKHSEIPKRTKNNYLNCRDGIRLHTSSYVSISFSMSEN